MSEIVCVNVCPQGGMNHMYDLKNAECLHPNHDDVPERFHE